jgi:hypothetical protein
MTSNMGSRLFREKKLEEATEAAKEEGLIKTNCSSRIKPYR